jgi:protein gp37
MGERTHISWCDSTFNPWIGCQHVGPACDFCYAEAYGNRFGVAWGAGEDRRRTSPGYWRQLRRWDAKAAREGTRPFVFGGSLCDVFDNQVDPLWRRQYFDEIRASPHLVLLLLTKRPSMIRKLSEEAGGLPPNVALGATVVNPEEVARDVRHLVLAKEALNPLFTFASVEPILGAVAEAFRPWLPWSGQLGVDWVVAGGESGPHARPWSIRWARELRDVCAETGAVFHWKQNGEWAPGISAPAETPGRFAFGDYAHDASAMHVTDFSPRQFTLLGSRARATRVGKAHSGRLLDGVLHDGRPEVPAYVR